MTLVGTLLSFYVLCDTADYDEVTDTWSPSGTTAYYFHNGLNELGANVVWQGVTYQAFPLQAEGFEIAGNGKMPRPVIRTSNIGNFMGDISSLNNDLSGWCVIRKRTFAVFLDAVNFTNGNPEANPTEHLMDDIFYVDRKIEENKLTIAWELAAASDLQSVLVPGGQIVANYCPSEYNYSGKTKVSYKCTYNGPQLLDGTDAGKAGCTHLLGGSYGCAAHFAEGVDLPFGGFPGCGLRRG